jgi:hypothetical protein
MNKTCDVCGREYQKIVINSITKYCAGCDHVYKFEPMDVEPIIELLYDAINSNIALDCSPEVARYEALRACITALEGDDTKLKALAEE